MSSFQEKNPPDNAELLAMFQAMRNEFSLQRAELEQKIVGLESELSHLKNQQPLANTVVQTEDTSRRRMLKKLAVGVAGVAALGMATAGVAPNAQAGTFDFNGNGVPGGGQNLAEGTNRIYNANNAQPFPMLILQNNSLTPGSPTAEPDNQSIGLLARSNSGLAVYAESRAATGTSPTGVLGISGNSSLFTNPLFQNEVGGIVGVSDTNAGVVGLSQSANAAAVSGIGGIGYGIKGVSIGSVGGAFGVAAANQPTTGAALRLGLRDVFNPPGGVGSSHDAGEVYLDKLGRFYICQAGYNPPGTGKADEVVPTNTASDALAFPKGFINPNGSSWRQMTPITIRSLDPDEPFTRDPQLHVEGEIWVDNRSGTSYICIQSGTKDDPALNAAQVAIGLNPARRAVFKRIAGGTTFTALPVPDRFVDTRPQSLIGTAQPGPLIPGLDYVFSMTGRAGRDGQIIPTTATLIVGNITVIAPVGNGFVRLLPAGTPGNVGTSTVNFNSGFNTANSFNVLLVGGQVVLRVFQTTSVQVAIDVVGYYN